MNFNYFCRLGFAFILLAVTTQHTLFSMDIPFPASSLEGDDRPECKDLEVWPSMRFDRLKALLAVAEAQEYLIKAEASREATSTALQNFCSTVLPFCTTTESLINMCRDATPEQLAAFCEMIHPLFDETGQPDIGSWREIVYHLKGLTGAAPLHATQHILYQLRDQYTPALIRVCSTNTPTATTTPAQRYLQTLNSSQLELFAAIRNGLVAGFQTFDTVKSTEIQEMLEAQNNSAEIQPLVFVLGNSWMEDIRTRALNQKKIHLYIKQTPSPLSKTPSPKTASPSPEELAEIEKKSYAPELRFTFSRATPTVSFAIKFFKNFFVRNCEKIQVIHYNPTTPKVVLRGKLKDDTHKRWIYIKILGKAKSTNCGAADREARGHGYYLGWVNPNHGHLVINFEVKTAANEQEAAKEFPEMMELQANGHMLVAFPDADDIQRAMQSLCKLDPEAKRVTPSEHAAKTPSSDREEEPRPATPPFAGKEQMTKCLRKWEAAYINHTEMLQKVANGTALSAEQIAFQAYIEQGKGRLTEFKLIVDKTPDEALESIWEDIYQATHDYTNGQQIRLYSRAFPKHPRDFRYPGPQQVNNKIKSWEKSERRFQGALKKLSGSQQTDFISLLEEFSKALREFKGAIERSCTTAYEPIWNTLAPRIEELQKLLVEHLPSGA